MYFCDLENRERKHPIDGISLQSFWLEKMMLAVIEIDAHSGVPPHDHPHEQIGVVISGHPTFTIGDETRTLKPGDCYIVPGELLHGVTTGDDAVRLAEVFAPPREAYKY